MLNTKNASILVSQVRLRWAWKSANATTQVGIRDGVTNEFRLVPRDQATVSVFDSNFLIGDGIWVCVLCNVASLSRMRV